MSVIWLAGRNMETSAEVRMGVHDYVPIDGEGLPLNMKQNVYINVYSVE